MEDIGKRIEEKRKKEEEENLKKTEEARIKLMEKQKNIERLGRIKEYENEKRQNE